MFKVCQAKKWEELGSFQENEKLLPVFASFVITDSHKFLFTEN
jgi:hypothetical protein